MLRFKRIALIGVFAIIALVLVAGTAYAGVMETIKAVATAPSLIIGLITVILLYVMKAVPNDKIYTKVKWLFRKFGIGCTLGLNRYPWTAPFWERYVEPWAIDLIKNTVGAAVDGYIEGLRTNNKTE